uniref:Saposin A-type domain-containing protein n=1 Tax=Leersia perrieri TaxID=77586 RepID=A0A0D9VSY8_9ORYZ
MDAQRRRVLLVALVSAVAAVAAGALLPQPRAEAAAEKVPLALYYETLCPYCSRFIVNHLAGIFEDGLIAAVDLRLVPYGNAHVVGANNTITCQHGSQECFLNTVEACAIDAWPDLRVHFRFIYCVEELVVNHKQQEWESCFAKLNLDPKPVTDCYKSERGHQLSLKYGRQTDALQPPHKYVPWVVVDGQPLYEDYENFESYICKAYKGQPPKVCKGLRMLATESVTTTLGDMKLRPDEDDQTRPRSRRRFEGSADHLLKELLWPYSFKTYAEKAFLWVANQKNPLLCPHLPSHQVSATE